MIFPQARNYLQSLGRRLQDALLIITLENTSPFRVSLCSVLTVPPEAPAADQGLRLGQSIPASGLQGQADGPDHICQQHTHATRHEPHQTRMGGR